MKKIILLVGFIMLSIYFYAQPPKKSADTIAMPTLSYPLNALEPYISLRTMDFHYNKHLKGYVTNLNKAIAGTAIAATSIENIINNTAGSTFNNAAQVWNHTVFFQQFSKEPKALAESSSLYKAIVKQFGSMDEFKKQFSQEALALFGSGWTWLVVDKGHKLKIMSTENADNPIHSTPDAKTLLAIDVWEHAYYLDYQNKRTDYINGFFSVLDWTVIEKRFNH